MAGSIARDGGQTFSLVGWVGEIPQGFEIMLSTVRCSKTRLVTAIRCGMGDCDSCISIRRSDDNGETWEELARFPQKWNSNPGALVKEVLQEKTISILIVIPTPAFRMFPPETDQKHICAAVDIKHFCLWFSGIISLLRCHQRYRNLHPYQRHHPRLHQLHPQYDPDHRFWQIR